jgi:hypothetical protein
LTALDLLKSVVFAAIISGVIALVVAFASARTAKSINRDKLALDRELAESKSRAEVQLAERRFELDRKLALAKRRAEVAEKVLRDFYTIKHSFQAIRSPMIWAAEMVTEKGVEEEVVRNDGYGVIRRIRQYEAQFAELDASRFTFAALFGGEAAAPFTSIVHTHNEVFHAAEALLKYRKSIDDPNLQGFLTSMRRTAFSAGALDDNGEPLFDLVSSKIDEAVARVEALCRPALESEMAAEAAGREA